MALQFFDYASTMLSTGVNASQTTFNVVTGASFPLTPGNSFYATLIDQPSYQNNTVPPAQREVVLVTAVSGNTLTVQRGVSTPPLIWNAGDVIECRANAAALSAIAQTAAGSYTAPYPGAVARTATSKLSDIISVLDFGAVGNDATVCDTAIAAAISAAANKGVTGGTVYFPSGVYKITQPINISASNVMILGDGTEETLFKQYTPNVGIFNVTGANCQFEKLATFYVGTPVAGATAFFSSGPALTVRDVYVLSAYAGFEITGGSAQVLTNFQVQNYVAVGVFIHNTNDVILRDFILNAGNASNGSLGGIRLQEKVEAAHIVDGDILLGAFAMTVDASSYTIGVRPAYCLFTNVFFDSATQPVVINNMVETDFMGCWFSCGRDGASGSPGLSLLQTDSLRFTNTKFIACGSHGVTVGASSLRTVFVNCKAESNSATAGANVADGFVFANGASTFTMIGCVAHNGLFGSTQRYGVNIGTGCDSYAILGCNLNNNATGAISNGSTTASNRYVAQTLPVSANLAQSSGWSAPAGTLSRATFDQSTVTLPQLAQRVAALITDLTAQGIVGS